MRYESIPRKVIRFTKFIHKTLYEEFGKWLYLLYGMIAVALYKPVLAAWNAFSQYILYAVLGALGLYILYYLIRRWLRI